MALGAAAPDVMKDVVRRGATIAGSGIVLGLLGGVASARLLGSLLYATPPSDPPTYAAVSTLLAVVALAACLIPALRAARVDPIVALRHE